MKKFKEEELKNALGFNEEEAKIIMSAQKKFPELLAEEMTINSAKKLYEELGLDKSHWANWYKRNIINNKFFLENQDWWGFALMVNGNETKDFKLSIEFSKHLAMQTPINNPNGFVIRRYFILMEKAVKNKKNWIMIREPEKDNYNKMKEEILKKYAKEQTKVTKMDEDYLLKRESRLIDVSLTGYTATELKSIIGYEGNNLKTRDNLREEVNAAIDYLQGIIIGLVVAGLNFDERSKIIKNICDSKYSHLKMV